MWNLHDACTKCAKSALRNQFGLVDFLCPCTVLCQQGFNLCECDYEHSQCLSNTTENKAKKCIGIKFHLKGK